MSVKKVSRLWARICILSVSIGLFFMVFMAPLAMGKIAVYLGILLILFGFFIKFFFLRCNHCGWSGLMPRWSQEERIHCPKCGQIPEYDR